MVSNIQTNDFDAQREIYLALESACRALAEFKLLLGQAREEIPAAA